MVMRVGSGSTSCVKPGMMFLNRRQCGAFNQSARVLSRGGTCGGRRRLALWAAARKMKMCLNVGNIGVRANLMESIAMAAKFGFEAVDPNLKELAALSDSAMSDLLGSLQSQKLEFGSYAQAVSVNLPDDRFAAFVKDLDATAKTLKRARMKRFVTWLSSSDNNLTYLQNFKLHTNRIGEVAAVLGDNGISLGLEYVGPKTGWTRGKYPFIHTMATMKELHRRNRQAQRRLSARYLALVQRRRNGGGHSHAEERRRGSRPHERCARGDSGRSAGG